MSSTLPSPVDDYAAPARLLVNRAVWNAVFGSLGQRLRALEAMQADFESLINLGTGQALEMIAANVEPQLAAARAALTQLQADAALAQDVVAAIVAGSVPIGSVDGLAAALAAKASPADITAAIDALKGGAPAAYDTLVEIAAWIAAEDSAGAAITTALAQRLRVDAAQGLSAAAAAQGRANIGAAEAGENSDISALTGLTTPLALAQGGTGATTAAAAVAALGAAPRPISTAGVGQMAPIGTAAGNGFSLPSGGMWQFWYVGITSSQTWHQGVSVGIAAGGTIVQGGVPGVSWQGVAWRIS